MIKILLIYLSFQIFSSTSIYRPILQEEEEEEEEKEEEEWAHLIHLGPV